MNYEWNNFVEGNFAAFYRRLQAFVVKGFGSRVRILD